MKTHIILNRFLLPLHDIGIPRASYIHHWHLWQDGEPIDEQIDEPDEWGKGAYPVNWEGLQARTHNARNLHPQARPLVLEMEVGRSVFDYRHTLDRLALAHIGKVVRALGGVDCVYGHGWITPNGKWAPDDDESGIAGDLAVYTLIGCPDRLAVTAYGKWSYQWAPNLLPKIERARRLADSITYKEVRPVLFISPFVAGEGDMGLDEWRRTCEATRTVCERMDCDAMIWWDGGRDRKLYEYARPYVEAAREVLL